MKKTLIYTIIMMISSLLNGCEDFNTPNDDTEDFVVSFFVGEGSAVDSMSVTSGSNIDLPLSEREGYTFMGWTLTNDPEAEIVMDPLQINSNTTLYAKWVEIDWSDVELYIANLIPDELSNDIGLPDTYKEYSISWVSSNPDVVSNMGIYHRPYQATMLRCTAKRKVFRTGRQIGKTEVLVIAILFNIFNNFTNYRHLLKILRHNQLKIN